MRSAIAPPSRRREERHELDGAEQAGQEGRPGLRVELVGQRDERRLRPEPGGRLAAISSRRSRDARSGSRSGAMRPRRDIRRRPG